MMKNNKNMKSGKQKSLELPSLIKYISSNEEVGFGDAAEIRSDERAHSVAISMPTSPEEIHLQNKKRNLFVGGIPVSSAPLKGASSSTLPKTAKFHLQPIEKSSAFEEEMNTGHFPSHPSIESLKDKRFDTFKTWSRKLDRKITLLHGNRQGETESENVNGKIEEIERLTADRYFDALEGPELDTLRPSEEILLPKDKQWPFLLRYPVSSFSICLGVSSQAILWKALPTSASMKFLHLSLTINIVLWCISVVLLAIVSCIYLVKVALYFEAVRREYHHPIRINFFFAPWIALLFLALGVPPSFANNLHPSLWYILMTPLLCLELKIYGQWMLGGQRRLSKVANPFNHLAIAGNFVGALLGASMGLQEGPIFFFAIGFVHYIVLFVTLYQRLPTNDTVIPKELHPVFFLFVAAPSIASVAWAKIQGSFDHGSRIAYFISLFLYLSLVVRVNYFRGFKFSMAWWAYTFPMTGAAIATIKYSDEVTNVVTQALAVILSLIAIITVIALLITTILHGLVLQNLFPNDIAIAISDRKSNLFPNDIAIAISDRKSNPNKKWFHVNGYENNDSEAVKIMTHFEMQPQTSERNLHREAMV